MLYVCSLSKLSETVHKTGATHLVTLINTEMEVPTPDGIEADKHLFLGFNDIAAPVEGLTPPTEGHVVELIRFVEAWDQKTPLIIHCWAGISRSTAGAFISTCALNPQKDEFEIAALLRQQAPSATPNTRLVTLADKVLKRDGRMIDAVRTIGRGANAYEGVPFNMPLD
ncbi:protein tyrosine phosphatase [Roseibium sp. TrichSKD4]|uniref:tyrosine phosphatase family protein n=1 Tax=Roseibium sp. TrichSKD4 TaxID=744980 RepID=UPI0001E56124|nr:protein-tyrosine phosphatase family protein [Roseibium sp. TrichSKD4]EFO34391.1 protein tyrosine phosphatase [Roseibium sp. TrichSKD4]